VTDQQLNGAHRASPAGTPRARALGIPFGGTPGPWNAITDVPGVEVGYQTIIRGETARTGVTGIHPRGRGGAVDPLAAGYTSQNGNGEMTGAAWVEESGTTSLPIALTNTHAVGIAHAGIIAWAVRHYPELGGNWSLPVAAETWDGYLNDINGQHVTEVDCVAALDAARSGPLAEGAVGGGTGMICYGFKGGSGTASRLVSHGGASHGGASHGGTTYTVGVFVQANFGARRELVLAGRPLGDLLPGDDPLSEYRDAPPGAGSVIAIVITDAPLLPNQCKALARRVTLGLARTGTAGSHSSGDLFLACSTANPGGFSPYGQGDSRPYDQLTFVPWDAIDPFFTAVVQGTEEAVANALCAGEEMTGYRGHRVPGTGSPPCSAPRTDYGGLMEYRLLGHSGCAVSALALGTLTFGNETGEGEAFSQLDAFVAAGGTLVDSADVYADGRSEEIIGRWLAARPEMRDIVVLATKGRFPTDESPNGHGASRRHLSMALDASLRRLNVATIDLYQVHGWDPLTPLEETLRFLDDAVRAGKISYVGVSNFTGWQLQKAVDVAAFRGLAAPVCVQPQYNLLARAVEWEIVPACQAAGLGMLAWSPLASGWLTGKYQRGEPPAEGTRALENADEGMRIWNQRGQADRTWLVVDAVRKVANERGVPMAQVAIAWLLGRPAVSSVILGARTLDQLASNLAAADLTLSVEEASLLDEASEPATPDYPYGEPGQTQRSRRIRGGRF
jgi:aryl-alcohol dehydrogenase-like predicted oxidoreductase/L-aminopeptidase/D-esterase-like protein